MGANHQNSERDLHSRDMPGSTLVGVFVTTTHRISAVESGSRAAAQACAARLPKCRRNRGESCLTRNRSGAVIYILLTPGRSRQAARRPAPFSQNENTLVLNLRSSERTR